jgi:outer membrane protein TolC
VEDDIALKVRQLYYEILIAQLKREATKQEEDAAQIKFQENTSFVEQGSALEVVALESHAVLLGAKQAGLTQNLQIRDLTFELNSLLGLIAFSATLTTGTLARIGLFNTGAFGLPSNECPGT